MKVLSKEEVQQMTQQLYAEQQQSQLIYQGRLEQLGIMLQYFEEQEGGKKEPVAANDGPPKPVEPEPPAPPEPVDEEPPEDPEEDKPVGKEEPPVVEDNKVFNEVTGSWTSREQAERDMGLSKSKPKKPKEPVQPDPKEPKDSDEPEEDDF